MTDIAHYSFLPWLRQGLNAQIIEKDNLATGAGAAMERAQLAVELMVHADVAEGDGGNDQVISKKHQCARSGGCTKYQRPRDCTRKPRTQCKQLRVEQSCLY